MNQTLIRPFRPTDSASACELFRQVYGDHYVSPDVYMPHMICQHNQQKRWQSLVAVIGDRVVGHAALCRPAGSAEEAELALVAVEPGLQGGQIATRLGQQLVDRCPDLGLTRLSIKQVTSHPYSQQLAQRLGFHDTGLLPDYVPSPFATGQAETIVVGCQTISSAHRPLPSIQWPSQHRWLLEPLAVQFGTTHDKPPAGIHPLQLRHLPGRVDVVAERMDACLVGQLRRLPIHWPLSVRLGLGEHFGTDYRLLMGAGLIFAGIIPAESAPGWQALFHRVAQARQLTLHSTPMQRLHDELQAHALAWRNAQASSAA
ncbi:GNAT family N-acetyltransferase [Pseudomonas sp. SWRI92]|uniref:GNAT family N-acetyltransferase n=1 Tax=Pseudomonas marvdashtae TaxID=2745500 RepID=A0A923FK55_9PSED|nr:MULTISPECIES: GNAT family N-acetyltransferase [Pseudomonas]MBC3372547.1 GNAT family N-acetyltransferase [Pseudomonas sp. SWRI92]MBV4551749.1 GNAT family N-acetyltransferase [Pseudomonas marvdashtae]